MKPEIVKGFKSVTRGGYEIIAGPFRTEASRFVALIEAKGAVVPVTFYESGSSSSHDSYDLIPDVPDQIVFEVRVPKEGEYLSGEWTKVFDSFGGRRAKVTVEVLP